MIRGQTPLINNYEKQNNLLHKTPTNPTPVILNEVREVKDL
jgi:hypothetical protein